MRFEGKPVWVGQVSRDIGVRFTLATWNLVTHRIDIRMLTIRASI
jgi:LssY C-terminus